VILFRSPIIVVDTETTGFPGQPWAHVIELGAIHLDEEGNEVGTFEALVNPPVFDERADKALEINKIPREAVLVARRTELVLADYATWHGARFATSYNVAFDRPMVERMGFQVRWASCVMLRAMAVMGPANVLRPADPTHPRYERGRPWLWPSLASAAEFFQVQVEGEPHRALTDARTAARVAIEIRRRELSNDPQTSLLPDHLLRIRAVSMGCALPR
jgi:DNA polymerase III epsilon subunit-like protein